MDTSLPNANASPRAFAAVLAARARQAVRRGRSAAPVLPRTPTSAEAAIAGANGRFPGVVYGAHQKNAYKPQVSAVPFPIITLNNPNTPPSLNPHPGTPRQGPTPNPIGYTFPGGAFSKRR